LLIAIIFCFFAVVNLNDPDGFIWVPVYVTVAFLPLASIEKVSVRLLKFCSLFYIYSRSACGAWTFKQYNAMAG